MSAPAVAVSANGSKFAAAWKDVRSGEPNIYWSISDSTYFAAGQLLHDETTGKQDHPSLCIDASGTVWAAWEDGRAGSQQVWIRSSRPNDVGHAISETEDASASFPAIATGKGLLAVVYESQTKDEKAVRLRVISRSN